MRRDALEKLDRLGQKVPPFLTALLATSLKGSGVRLTPPQLAGLSVGCFGVGAVFGLLLGGLFYGPPYALILGLAAAAGPALGCKAAVGFRAGKLTRQLEAAAEELAGEVNAGKSLPEVVRRAAERLPRPLREELACVLAEHALGLPFDEAWERLAARVRTAEVVQIVGAFSTHLEKGADPLELVRKLSLRQPFDIPPLPPFKQPATLQEAIHQLHVRVLDSMDCTETTTTRAAGAAGVMAAGKAELLFDRMALPAFLKGERQHIVEGVKDEVDGPGPLGTLLRNPAVQAVYVVSPKDVFGAPLPGDLADGNPEPGAMAPPEGYQRARARFRYVRHLRLITNRLLAPLGSELSPSNPTVEGTLDIGWAVAAQLTEGNVPALALGRPEGGASGGDAVSAAGPADGTGPSTGAKADGPGPQPSQAALNLSGPEGPQVNAAPDRPGE